MSEQHLTLDTVLQHKAAQSDEKVNINEKRQPLVIFSLQDEYYAFYGDNIREILPDNTPIFFVPGCSSALSGVINLRGEIESVIDLGLLLQLPVENLMIEKTLLLAHNSLLISAISVQRVIDVIDMPKMDIQPAPTSLPEHLQSYVLGIVPFAGKAVALLNIDKLFAYFQQALKT